MSFQNLIRRVFPKEESFFDLLERLGTLNQSAVATFRKLAVDGATPDSIAEAVQEVEHAADKVFHEVETGLARTFVTPIDREDIHQIAFEIDDIVDMVNLAARTCALFRITEFTPPMVALLDTLERCSQVIAEALPWLRKHDYTRIIAAGREVRALEKDADTVFRQTLSALFQDPAIDAKELLKQKELVEHIEDAVDRCDRLANTLCNLAVKHG
jgi:uncharacterized protein Yka (UPF0111/DUF47 family)